MLRPGTDWENNAPRVLCESFSVLVSELLSPLIESQFPSPLKPILGRILGDVLAPAISYALCGDYGTTSPPLDGENELPESNLTFGIRLTRKIKAEVYKPPSQLKPEISTKIYSDEPASTKFPLYKAVSARESLKNKKFGCILYQPVSDEPMKLKKCNIQRPSIDLERLDQKRLADFIVKQKSNTLATGVAIMTTMNRGRITTGVVVGPYVLSATAVAYAAFNKQMYSAPITKVPKRVEYEECTMPAPSIDVPFSIKGDAPPKLEPFIEITSPLAGVSN